MTLTIIFFIPLILNRSNLETRSSKVMRILITLILAIVYISFALSKEIRGILSIIKKNTLRNIGIMLSVVLIAILWTLFGKDIPQNLKITWWIDIYTMVILIITGIVVPMLFIQQNYIKKYHILTLLWANIIIIILTIITYNYTSEISSSYRALWWVIGAWIMFQLAIDRLIFELIKNKWNKIKWCKIKNPANKKI